MDARLLISKAVPAVDSAGGQMMHARFFQDPWFDAPNYNCTLVATPNRGTLIGSAGTRSDCSDDPVAAIVAIELERWLYGGPLTCYDVAGTDQSPSTEFTLDLRSRCDAPPSSPDCFRFGSVAVQLGIDPSEDVLAEQIGSTLWRMLHPQAGPLASRPLHTRVFRHAGVLGVWSRSGIMIAHSPEAQDKAQKLRELFNDIVSCARDVHGLLAELKLDAHGSQVARTDVRTVMRARVARGEEIMRRMADVRHRLTLPEGRLLNNFVEDTGLEGLAATLRDLCSGQRLEEQNERLADHNERLGDNIEIVADVQSKLEWLELLFVGIYATEVAHIFADYAICERYRLVVVMLSTVAITTIAALFLKPWSRKPGIQGRWLLIAFGVQIAIALGIGFWLAIDPRTCP